MIQSHELPERMVEINGVRKYRVNVQEVGREDAVVYTYDEVEFNVDTPIEISDAKVERLKAKLVEAEAKEYLNNTDWYVARYGETGVAIPDDIKAKRAECRELIK